MERSVVVTLEGIAKHSCVSRSTVSRVINNDPHVSRKTRARVLAAVQKLNYHPNVAARGLAAGRTRILGLVIPMGVSALFADPYFPILIQGVSAACNAHDHSVMLWLAEPDYERRMISKILHNGLVDGVIVASMLLGDSLMRSLVASNMPFVLVGRHPTNSRINSVDVDNVASAKQMVEHLFDSGYRRVATIAGPSKMIAGVDRLQGYTLALQHRGIATDPKLICISDFSENGGYVTMQALMAQKPDAVFAASDAMAVGALRAVREAGLRVPYDVAIAGFDDMPFAERTDPPLTTVRQPIHQAGYKAAETLINLIVDPGSQPSHTVLPTEIIIRASTRRQV